MHLTAADLRTISDALETASKALWLEGYDGHDQSKKDRSTAMTLLRYSVERALAGQTIPVTLS